MENRQWQGAPSALLPGIANLLIGAFGQMLGATFTLLFLASISSALTGCAAPGEPYERKPPTPMAVTDLSAAQAGNDVVLTFTLPQQAVDRRPLDQLPSVEIYRDFQAPGQARPSAHPALLVTVPAAMVENYVQQGHFRFSDALRPEDFAQHPDSVAVYSVQTRVSEKKVSAASNLASVRIYPAAEAIFDLKAEVTHAAVVLTWTPPGRTLAGTPPPVAVYHIYRGVPDASVAAGSEPKLKSPLVKIADAQAPPFEDAQFEFGASYVYSVRSVAQYSGGAAIESADSNLVEVSPRDTFPPAAPQGLVVVLVPLQGDAPAHLELSWSISPETDIAGYNVYRSEQEGAGGLRLNGEGAEKLLPTPAFSDMNVQPGHRYFYTVTAVDRAGNESPAGAVVSGDVPAESQTKP
jgi:hypothetical protein